MIDKSTFSDRKALFHTFGCKLNFAETSTVAKMLAGRGIISAREGETPDIIVVNTCSVTELADKKCRQAIRAFNRRYPAAAIVVTGCYAQLKAPDIEKMPGVVIVAGNDRKLEIADAVERWLDRREPVLLHTPVKDIRSFSPSCARGDRTRFFLKVQDGCDYFCSYCTIPYARGRSRSATIDSLVAQASGAAAEGGKEIVITGVNIGDFGKGRQDTFFDLMRALDQVEGIERYRISSIEPNLLTDEMIEWVAGSRAFMPHFHIPLQSGSDAVLQLMRRRYGTSVFRHRVETIREVMPHAFIGVDLIVGARGETPEEFAASRDFVDSLAISRLRARTMLDISDRKLKEFTDSFIGTVRPVLVEHRAKGDTMGGFTDNYLRVSLPADASLDNRIVPVRLLENLGEEARGEVVI